MSDEKPNTAAQPSPDRGRQERQEREERLDLSRFSMNEVEGEDTDRPAEKPKRTMGLLVLVVVGVFVVAGIVTWMQGGFGTGSWRTPQQQDKAKEFVEGLLQTPALRDSLERAEFVDQNRLKIVIADAVTEQEVEQVVRAVAEAFSKFRPNHALTVYAFQGEEGVASADYDAETRRISVGPPVPITGPGSMSGALGESGAGGR